MIWTYDIEVYRNFFSVTFKNYKTKQINQFIIHEDRNDINEIVDFISNPHLWLVGYNNFYFDNQLLKYLYLNRTTFMSLDYSSNLICQEIYNLTRDIIEQDNRKFCYNLPFKFFDMIKIGNLKNTSLKMVGTVLKWPKLQDLPLPVDSLITKEDIDVILKYNLNDVEITEKLFSLHKDAIKLRLDISKEYNVDVYSESNSGVANKLLEKFYSESTGLQVEDFKNLRTHRGKFMLKDVIMPDIFFRTKELNKFLNDLKKTFFYDNIPFMKKSFILHGTKYVSGIGGLHSKDSGGYFKSDDKTLIIDADVGSFYPTMIINHNIHPKHLGTDFIRQYKDIRDKRFEAKKKAKDNNLDDAEKAKYSAIDSTFKLILNSTYGKMKFENHWLYDSFAALQVTINCQLYLLMLIEFLGEKGFNVISANTDGIVTIVPVDRKDEYETICKQWENATAFNLEFAYYKVYARRDVNNYIAIKENGDVKTKGDFVYPDLNNLESDPNLFMRGFDKPIIAKALYEYFVNDIPVEETIVNHKDIYDFCISQKTDKKFTNEFHTIKDNNLYIEQLQQSVRFYISNKGGVLYKKDETGKMINYCVGQNVTIFNNYVEKNDYDINYSYYIKETKKMIELVKPSQLKLF